MAGSVPPVHDGTVTRSNFTNVYLTFDTAVLGSAVTVVASELKLYHLSASTTDNVLLYGGTQPIFGATVEGADCWDGTTSLGSEGITTIQSQGFADFTVTVDQINKTGLTQFRVAMDSGCPWPSGNQFTNRWMVGSPHAAAGTRPELNVTYQP